MSKNLSSCLAFSFVLALVSFISGCGGGSSPTSGNTISVTVSPATATVTSGGTVQFTATVTGDSSNAGVTWSVSSASPTSGTIDATGKFTAASVTKATTATVVATSKTDTTKSASATVTINPPAAAAVTVSPQTAFVSAGQVQQFTATVTGESATTVAWSVNGTPGGNSTVGTIDAMGNYTAPPVTQNATATVTATSTADSTKSANAAVSILAAGVVTSTANVQVASYTITPPATANVSIQFGPDTTYGLNTWQQPSATGGGAVTILVAGMRMNTQYHLRANVVFADGTQFNDVDHTFMTGTVPAANLPGITVSTTAGAKPQSGVELLDMLGVNEASFNAVVTDLAGNVIWTFNPPVPAGAGFSPLKMLTNGHFIAGISAQPDGMDSSIEEFDLAGNVIWSLTGDQLNTALSTATCTGCSGHNIVGMHHDFAVLPNGHIVVIVAERINENGLTGEPSPSLVTGDLLIDLDQNHNPVWLWSSFDHLDLNRHPLGFPDWTHTNSVVYSPDDKALIVSMRDQDWVLKIDYNDGQGTGNILWHLGYQGDFTLVGGTDPIDWFYAQHDANVITPNSSGVFSLTLFDDGNNRVLNNNNDASSICGLFTAPQCTSHDPIYKIDETAMTATITFLDDASPLFALFGGSSRVLTNTDVEFDICGLTARGTQSLNNQSDIFEVTQTSPPQPVWQMNLTGNYAYRAFRIPSLYPGVQW
ncbi:MAG TPA: aryl-sulfate sulfotransferase [Candidatus Sulfotelmatobacter sp.]|nr:aryl-sulfate sulfotransferase [Candidatus Sulfotelmatobacter sp.]